MAQSSVEKLKQQTGISVPEKPKTFASMLEAMRPEFAKVLPRAMSAERLIRIATTEVRKTPKLAACDMQSVIGSIMIGAQLGLEPGVMGQAYLVPFENWKTKKSICTFIPGWQGYVDLVSRSGRASCWTGAVYEGDEFDASLGSEPFVHHKPDWDAGGERRLLYTYAVGEQKGATRPVVDVWGFKKVIDHRTLYNKIGDKHYSYKDPNNMEMYARKLPLLQVIKYLPKSVELAMTAGLDYSAEAGTQSLTIESAVQDGPLELSPSSISAFDEKFELLCWNDEERAEFLELQKGKSDADIHDVLDAELERE